MPSPLKASQTSACNWVDATTGNVDPTQAWTIDCIAGTGPFGQGQMTYRTQINQVEQLLNERSSIYVDRT